MEDCFTLEETKKTKTKPKTKCGTQTLIRVQVEKTLSDNYGTVGEI